MNMSDTWGIQMFLPDSFNSEHIVEKAVNSEAGETEKWSFQMADGNEVVFSLTPHFWEVPNSQHFVL